MRIRFKNLSPAFKYFFSVFAVALIILFSDSLQAADNGIKVAVLTNTGGAHLHAYFEGLANTEEVESVVLGDPDNSQSKLAREVLKDKLTQVYSNYDELLKTEKPEMALVSMEAALAPEVISSALEAGCHVLSEKPACIKAEDFEKLVKKASEKKLHLMLALANRLNPEVVEAKRIVSEGLIGEIYGVQLNLIKDQTRLKSKSHQESWYSDKNRSGGGHLIWLGIHWLDLSMYITDSKVTRVTGFAGNVGGQPVNIEDSAVVALEYDNGTFGTMTSGYFLDRGIHANLNIWGSHGWIKLDYNSPRDVTWYSTKPGMSKEIQVTKGSDHNAYGTFVRAAVRASAGLQDPPITGDECLLVLKTVFGLYKSSETEKAVHVR